MTRGPHPIDRPHRQQDPTIRPLFKPFRYYQDQQGEWRWQLRSRNGRIISSSSEGFSRKWSAKRNAHLTTHRLDAYVG